MRGQSALVMIVGLRRVATLRLAVFAAFALAGVFSSVVAQQTEPTDPVVVQPGAPGQPTRRLPSSTRATLPPPSPADVQFMQHMILHHGQAVEMTALHSNRTRQNKELRTLGRANQQIAIRRNEVYETVARGEGPTDFDGDTKWICARNAWQRWPSPNMLMPGMLTAKQMDALRNARGKEFDRLFLSGMIQHHNGALVMVKDLFNTSGAGEDAELFNFATDVDSGQRAEIKVMQNMLGEKP